MDWRADQNNGGEVKTNTKTINTTAQVAAAKPGVHRVGRAPGLYLKKAEGGGGPSPVNLVSLFAVAMNDGPQ
jgi:hypothetical protein